MKNPATLRFAIAALMNLTQGEGQGQLPADCRHALLEQLTDLHHGIQSLDDLAIYIEQVCQQIKPPLPPALETAFDKLPPIK